MTLDATRSRAALCFAFRRSSVSRGSSPDRSQRRGGLKQRSSLNAKAECLAAAKNQPMQTNGDLPLFIADAQIGRCDAFGMKQFHAQHAARKQTMPRHLASHRFHRGANVE